MKTNNNIIVDSNNESTKNSKRIFNAFCFTDVHNCFTMLEPPYKIRKTALEAIDLMLRDYGKMDVVFVGGDLISDYPHWNYSGWLPYKFCKEYKELLVKNFARLAKDEKVHYIAGNHDYAQGESYDESYNLLVNGGEKGPGKNGSYNSFDYYFTGPMDKTFGKLSDNDMCMKISEHTGEKYLLAFYYEVNGVGIFGLAPDPDAIFSSQGHGFTKESLEWLKNKLDEVDPEGNKVMFLNCHYVINQRYPYADDGFPPNGVDIEDDNSDIGEIYSYGGDAPELADYLKGHKNLFHLFGHSETWFKGYTSSAIFHYDTNGQFVEFDTLKRSNPEGVISCENRGFNGVYMGHFRPAGDRYKNWFDRDTIKKGYGGFKEGTSQIQTADEKVSQGMYIEVYEDRVVFTMKNFGHVDGWRYEDKNIPYTVYLNK